MRHRSLLLCSLLAVPFLATAPRVGTGMASTQTTPQLGVRATPRLELHSPIRAEVAPSGNLLITDHDERRIVEVRPNGFKKIREIELRGHPIAVAAHGGFIYVSHDRTDEVQVFQTNGSQVGSLGGPHVVFEKANDIAVDETLGHLVVVDSVAKVVRVFDVSQNPLGTEILTIPPAGPDNSLLACPAAVAVDAARAEILVSDFGDTGISIKPRVQIFNYQGNLVSSISGAQGMMGYRFFRPQGLTVNEFGRIYLADSYLGQVLVLDRMTGDTITTFGSFGTAAGELRMPLDVAIAGPKRNLYVTNNGAGRIEIFPLGGQVQ